MSPLEVLWERIIYHSKFYGKQPQEIFFAALEKMAVTMIQVVVRTENGVPTRKTSNAVRLGASRTCVLVLPTEE